jgi:hypothetical protein
MFIPFLGGDPIKRKKNLKFLGKVALLGAVVYVGAFLIQGELSQGDPLKTCIDNRETPYRISVSMELIIDGNKADIPAKIGMNEGCTHTLYTLSDDGIIYAEWEEEYPFELGHFLWTWTTYHEDGFPMRDMESAKSRILVNGEESADFINTVLVDGQKIRAEFVTKEFEETKDKDYLPDFLPQEP